MTVQVDDRKVISPGNGSAVSFPFTPIVIFEETDLEVRHYDSDGVETILDLGSADGEYQVDVTTYPGTGEVAFVNSDGDALPNGEGLIIKRVLPLEQQTDLGNQKAYNANVVETSLDRGIMIDLQQQETLDRAVAIVLGADLSTFDLNAPEPVPDTVLKVNATGTGFEWAETASEALVAEAVAAADDAETAQAAAEAAQAAAEAAAALVPTPDDPGDDDKFLQAQGGVYVLTSASVTGDVVGPASAGDNSVPLYDGTTGKLLKAGVALGTLGHPLKSAGAGAPPVFGQIPAAGIASDAVTTAKILDNNVTLAKLARVGNAGEVLISGGAGADAAFGVLSAGQNNDGQNLGATGKSVYAGMSGVHLTFRKLIAGAVTVTNPNGFTELASSGHTGTMTFTENTNDITVTLAIVLNTSEAPGGGE